MKINNFFIIFYFLNYYLIFVNSTCKDILIEYTETNKPIAAITTCIANNLPIVTFTNYGIYKKFEITPTPLNSINNNLNFEKIVTFAYDTEYTVTYNVGSGDGQGCTDQTKTFLYPQLSPPVSSFNLIQGKCIYSESTIKVNTSTVSSYKLISNKDFSNNGDISITPNVVTSIGFNSGSWLLNDVSLSNQYDECNERIVIDLPLTGYPQLNVQPSICYGNNGSISVASPSSYQSIELVKASDSNTILTSSVGSFTSLASGSYLLTLTSTTCGKQTIPIEIESQSPRLLFSMIDTTCPSKPKIQVKIDDPSIDSSQVFTMKLGSATSDSSNTLTPTIPASGVNSLLFSFAYKTCDVSFNLPISQAQMNLAFSIENNGEPVSLFDCSSTSNTNVKLQYDKSSITDLSVTSVSDGSVITPVSDTTYSLNPSNQLSITSSCFVNPLFLQLPQPEPIFEIDGSDSVGCWENTSISIFNHLDFYSIKLVPIDSPTTSIPIDTITGKFNNIYRKNYNLVYQYCSNSPVSSKPLNLATTTSTLSSSQYTLSQVGNDLDCLTGKLQLKATLKNSDKSTFDVYSNWTPNQLDPVSFKINDHCIVNLNFNPITPITTNSANYLNLNNKPIIKINKAKCLYSNDGSIEINSNGLEISKVIIGDKIFEKSSNGIYGGLNVGEYSVSIIYSLSSGNGFCGGMKYDVDGSVTIDSIDNQFIFTATSTAANCLTSTNDGTISITNPTNYKSLTIDGSSTNQASTGIFSNLAAGYHTVSFESQDSTCSGSVNVFVSSAGTQPTIALNILRQPTCYRDSSTTGGITASGGGDGLVFVGLFDSSTGNSITVSKVIDQSLGYQFTPSSTDVGDSIISVAPGNNKEFVIYSNTCAYKQSINVPFSNAEISYKTTSEFNCVNNFENGKISSVDSTLALINSIKITGTNSNFTQKTISASPFSIYNLQSDQYSVLVKWNDVCQMILPIITKSIPIITPPTYQISTTGPSGCGISDYDTTLQINNFDSFSDLSINGQRPDGNGYFHKLPITNGIINYIDKTTQCIGSLDFNIDSTLLAASVADPNGINKTMETCHGSCNGELQLSNSILDESNYYYSSISIRESSKPFLTPILSIPTSTPGGINYLGISSTDLQFRKIKKSNPFCISSQSIQFTSSEPVLIDTNGESCLPFNNEFDLVEYINSTDPITNVTTQVPRYTTQNNTAGQESTTTTTGSIIRILKLLDDVNDKLESLPSDFTPTYSLVNSNNPSVEITPSANAGDYSQLSFGDYIMKASIPNRQCKRTIVKSITVSETNNSNTGFLVKVDQENYCERVRIVPNDMNQAFNYYIYNSSNQVLYEYLNQTGIVMSDFLDSTKEYTLKAIQVGLSSSNSDDFISSCEISIKSKVCKDVNFSKIKLIVGLVLGLLVAAFIIAFAIYQLRQRHLKKKQPHSYTQDDDKGEESSEQYENHHGHMMVEM